jgi:hypothetical protein
MTSWHYRWTNQGSTEPADSPLSSAAPRIIAPLDLDIDAVRNLLGLTARQECIRAAVLAALYEQEYATAHDIDASGIAITSDLSDAGLSGNSAYEIDVQLLTAKNAEDYLRFFFSPTGSQATLGVSQLETTDHDVYVALAASTHIQLDINRSLDEQTNWKLERLLGKDASQTQRGVSDHLAKLMTYVLRRVTPQRIESHTAVQWESMRMEVDLLKDGVGKGSFIRCAMVRDTRQRHGETPPFQTSGSDIKDKDDQ